MPISIYPFKTKGGKQRYRAVVWHQGKRKSRIFRREKAAQEYARIIEAKLALGEGPVHEEKKPVETVRQRVDRWLQFTATCRERTRDNYAMMVRRHAYPVIADIPLVDLKRADMRGVVETMRAKGLSRSAINNVIAPIRQALAQAREDEIIAENPATELSKHLPRKKDSRAKFDFLTQEKAIHLLTVTGREFPQWFGLFATGIYCGLRLGELLFLKWGDIDFNGGFIEVRRGVPDGDDGETKSGKLRRVDLSDVVADALQRLRVERKREALAKGWGEVPEWIWPSEAGGPLDIYNFRRRVFYRVLEQAGIRRMRPHDCFRHTFASILLQNGESLTYVREQCGHASIKMTVDVYGHLVPGENRKAVNNLLGEGVSFEVAR